MSAAPESLDVLIESTTSLCPEFLERVQARIVQRNGSALLIKRCPRHGDQTALLEKNAGYYLARAAFDKPGTASKTQTSIQRGCPFDCGLCPDHRQHTCIGLIEITTECNLACPDCYARPASDPNAAPGKAGMGRALNLDQIERMMDFFQEAESGKAEVLQVSGGEPTLHPRILEILRLAKAKRFKCVMLNTNGLRLAEEERFAAALGELAGGFEVYLQLDGFDGDACRRLRGRDLVAAKLKAVEDLARYRVPTTLVATIRMGVNDHEVGRLIQFGLEAENVRGINFQPLAFFRGAHAEASPRGGCEERDGRDSASAGLQAGIERTTVTDILERIEDQTNGLVRLNDFVPLPCDVERVAITFLYRSGGGFRPITRGADLRRFLPAIPNTFAFDADEMIARASPAAASQGGCDCAEPLLRLLRPLIPKAYGTRSPAEKREHVSRNTFRISVSSFVDPYNFDLKSMQRECVHVLTPDLRRIPFSAYNMFHRHE